MSSKSSIKAHPLDYSTVTALPQVWQAASQEYDSIIALYDPHSTPEVQITYKQLNLEMQQFAAGLQALGVKEQDKVALFADNSPRWFIADQGIMFAGAVDVVRSATAERLELLYILENSDSTALVIEDLKTLEKLQPELDNFPMTCIILLSDEEVPWEESRPMLNFEQLKRRGEKTSLQPIEQQEETLATLLYTSGTTGKPKGVMLTHGNLLHQIRNAPVVILPEPGDRVLSILPSWHAYERTAEYYFLSRGCTQIYAKIRTFKQDLKTFKPNFMVGVPRLWDSLYEGIQKQFREQPASKQRLVNFFLSVSERYIRAKRLVEGLSLDKLNPSVRNSLLARTQMVLLAPLHAIADKIVYQKVREATGGKLKYVISGGGSLAKHLDTFYEIVGIQVLVGYGLTETAPITNARRPNRNLRGSSGSPLPQTEVRIAEPKTRQTLPPGETGLVLIRGPQVMQGYYKQPEATAQAIDPEGWFNSGDLGWVTRSQDLVITGRAKDTIVLTNGENIEPQPIEDACVRSPYIDQMMLVGQDQKALGALIVPNLDALKQWVKESNLTLTLPEIGERDRKDLDSDAIAALFRQELKREVQNRPGYRPDDRIATFRLLNEPFSIENGMMTQTLKIRRPVISERYRAIIDEMFEK
jgi:long-chain acyl-CoA synthetase